MQSPSEELKRGYWFCFRQTLAIFVDRVFCNNARVNYYFVLQLFWSNFGPIMSREPLPNVVNSSIA